MSMRRRRRRALVSILSAERKIKQLAMDCYQQWLPAALRNVLPPAAGAMTAPPDPGGITNSLPEWEDALDNIFIPGLEDLINQRITEESMREYREGRGWLRRIFDRLSRDPSWTETLEAVESVPELMEYRSHYLHEVRNRMVRTPDTVFEDIAADLNEGIQQGESIDQLRDRVQVFLSMHNLDYYNGRAENVARTESCGALNGAVIQAAMLRQQATGEDLDKVWICTLDDKTRRTHAAADGQRVPLTGKFRVGTTEMRWPADPQNSVASEVCNCRCACFVLGADDPLPDENDRHTERGPSNATVQNREGSQADLIQRWRDDGIIRARDDPAGVGVASAAPQISTITDMTTPGTTYRTFSAMLMPLGVPDRGGVDVASPDIQLVDTRLPLALTHEHQGPTIGAIEQLEVRDGGLWATGVLLDNPDTEKAIAAADLNVIQPSVEIVVRESVAVGDDLQALDTEGEKMRLIAGEPIYMRWDLAELVAAALVAVPAWRETSFTVTGSTVRDTGGESLVASMSVPDDIVTVYPAAFFEDPQLEQGTPIHVTENGRVQGYLAEWGTCHTAVRDRCQTPYKSKSGYADFHQSHVTLDTGEILRVGRLTVGGGHGPAGNGMRAALEHYDNVATCWSLVRAGENAIGIWVSGVLNPAADHKMVQQALSAPHSGHWERVGGAPELVAAHAVNTPGFPIISRKRDRSGDLALIASFGPHPTDVVSVAKTAAREAVLEMRADEQAEQRRTAALQILGRIDDQVRANRARQVLAHHAMRRVRTPSTPAADDEEDDHRANRARRLLALAAVRRVRTPEGERRYGQPIGSVITPQPQHRNFGRLPRPRPPVQDLLDREHQWSNDELRDALSRGWNHQYGPYRLNVTEARYGTIHDNGFTVRSEIVDPESDDPIGIDERTFYRDPEGRPVVHHDLIILAEQNRGSGFGTALSQSMERYYRDSGVHRIVLQAGASDGGYAWAMAGYDWSPRRHQYERSMENMRNAILDLRAEPTTSPDDRRLLDTMLIRIANGDPPRPRALARLAGDDLKLGKKIMKGAKWFGTRTL